MAFLLDEWLLQHEFLYSNMDIGTYPIDIELLVDRTPTPDGTRGERIHYTLKYSITTANCAAYLKFEITWIAGPYGVRVVDLSKNRIHRIPDNIGANDSLETLVTVTRVRVRFDL